MKLPVIDRADLKNKRIFVRGDIDVPLKGGQVADDTRLKGIWPTVEYLLKQNCTVYLAGHLGRPGGVEKPELSSRPVAEWFKNKIQDSRLRIQEQEVSGVCSKGHICGFLVSEKLTVLENLRFDSREEANDEGFAKELAGLAEVYVNESFAESYREVASIVGVPKFLPHFAGFRLAKEVEVLSEILEKPRRPLLVIIGGAKLDTKLPVISKMAEVADQVVVGGKLVEEAKEKKELMNSKIQILGLSNDGKDNTLESIQGIESRIQEAATIVWNGPLGVVEDVIYQMGTRRLIELIVSNEKVYKVVGGGDTVAFLDKLGLTPRFDWVSSGGGSMLKFLSGESLPGLEALL